VNEIVHFARSSSHSATREAVPSRLEIERSFREVLRRIREDPDRDGLRETPDRLVRAFQEYFSGAASIIGCAWVAYVPESRVVGLHASATIR
jgi:GTP cyclohydrolase I